MFICHLGTNEKIFLQAIPVYWFAIIIKYLNLLMCWFAKRPLRRKQP